MADMSSWLLRYSQGSPGERRSWSYDLKQRRLGAKAGRMRQEVAAGNGRDGKEMGADRHSKGSGPGCVWATDTVVGNSNAKVRAEP